MGASAAHLFNKLGESVLAPHLVIVGKTPNSLDISSLPVLQVHYLESPINLTFAERIVEKISIGF